MKLRRLTWLEHLRQNHALEHATLHILAQRFPSLPLAGRTAWDGFYIVGAPDALSVEVAAREALARLQGGERGLNIHPRCGTGLVVGAFLVGVFTFLANQGPGRWRKLPRTIVAANLALLIAPPLGMLAQDRLTTAPPEATTAIGEVRFIPRGRGMAVHKVAVLRG